MGYGFLPEFWGQGRATEIAQACIRIGLAQLGFSSLVAVTLTDNHASQRVLVKSGLRYERDVLHAGLPHVLFRTVNEGVSR